LFIGSNARADTPSDGPGKPEWLKRRVEERPTPMDELMTPEERSHAYAERRQVPGGYYMSLAPLGSNVLVHGRGFDTRDLGWGAAFAIGKVLAPNVTGEVSLLFLVHEPADGSMVEHSELVAPGLSVDFKRYFFDGDLRPFIQLGAGIMAVKGPAPENEVLMRVLLNPGVGLDLRLTDALYVGVRSVMRTMLPSITFVATGELAVTAAF
jgi:hypothetical protein